MTKRTLCLIALGCSIAVMNIAPSTPVKGAPKTRVVLKPIGTYESGVFDGSGAEIVAHDPETQRLFVVNAAAATVDILDISDPTRPTKVGEIKASNVGTSVSSVNSVDVSDGIVAVAVESDPSQAAGEVAFYRPSGRLLKSVTVGALPDMLTFTPDGSTLVVANEGEPSGYCAGGLDPEGSLSVIDVSSGASRVKQADVKTADFRRFDNRKRELGRKGVRIYGPGASVSQDLEPEYVAVSKNSRKAWAILQENNALAIIDLKAGKVRKIVSLGTKDHSQNRNRLDASDEDGAIDIDRWPVRAMFQPDGMDAFEARGKNYLIMANEGDAREYECFVEEVRVEDIELDPSIFPDAAFLQAPENLGRLKTTITNPTNSDGQVTSILSYGGRSFSIRDERGELLFDSGSAFERITARVLPEEFNSTNAENGSFDSRSDDKGPEPEGVEIGRLRNRTYAFIGLERVGGVMVYDVTQPRSPRFQSYVNNRDFSGDPASGSAGDLGPEGLAFISEKDSPTADPLVVVANEVSGTTTIFRVIER